jgi:hypothetical protein
MAELLGLVSNVVQFADLATRVVGRAVALTAAAGVKYRRARFGIFGDVLYAAGWVDTDALQELHWNINIWTDAEVMAWKASHLATCNAIAVAVRKSSFEQKRGFLTSLGRHFCNSRPYGIAAAQREFRALVMSSAFRLKHDPGRLVCHNGYITTNGRRKVE